MKINIPPRYGMFRITHVNLFDIYFIHRKFYWWWIKWSIVKYSEESVVGQTPIVTNNVTFKDGIIAHLDHGKFQFSGGESIAYWSYIDDCYENGVIASQQYEKDSQQFEKTEKEFKLNNAELFI